MTDERDPERNRISARIGRVAQVGANMSSVAAARVAGLRPVALAMRRMATVEGWGEPPEARDTAPPTQG
jgi:hypothetical protein